MNARRIFAATMLLGLGVAGAIAFATLAKFGSSYYCARNSFGCDTLYSYHYSTPATWQIPVAVVIGFVGLAGAAAVALGKPSRGGGA